MGVFLGVLDQQTNRDGDLRGCFQKSESAGVTRQSSQATMSIDGIKDTRIPSKKSGVIDLLHRHNGSVTQLTLRMALWRVCKSLHQQHLVLGMFARVCVLGSFSAVRGAIVCSPARATARHSRADQQREAYNLDFLLNNFGKFEKVGNLAEKFNCQNRQSLFGWNCRQRHPPTRPYRL